MRLTTATRSKRGKNSKDHKEAVLSITKPNWDRAQMFTLKGESSDELDVTDRERSKSLSDGESRESTKSSSVSTLSTSNTPSSSTNSSESVGSGSVVSKEEKKRIAIRKYYAKWSAIYGEDVSHLSALQVQRRCIEKYEICCDIARYHFINEQWTKSKKWFNRSHRWCQRVDRKVC